MKYKLISIILPTFNRAHMLHRAIDSVFGQTYSNWELIIVDNNSIDDTDIVIDGYIEDARVKYFKTDNGGIIAKSRNIGIQKSKGELIAFLDSDDWWTDDKLAVSIREMELLEADLVYHNLFRVIKEKQELFFSIRVRRLKGNVFDDLLCNGNCIPNSSVVVKKKALSLIGCLSENTETNTWEDYDAWLRIAKYSNKIYKINKTMGYLWLGGGNESKGSGVNDALKNILININNFEERYKKEILNNKVYSWWTNYQKGKSLYSAKQFEESLAVIRKIKLTKVPYPYFFKVYFMIILINYYANFNER